MSNRNESETRLFNMAANKSENKTEMDLFKVDKWDGNAVKNALDDAVRKVFTEKIGFEENFKYVDIRLGLSALGCGVALLALLYDYLFPFPASRNILIICVLSYFTLMSILTLFTTFVEKNFVLVASEKDKAGLDPPTVWKIATSLKRFDHMYHVSIAVRDGGNKSTRDGTFSKSIAEWFDEDGKLVFEKFEKDVMKSYQSLQQEKKDN